MSGQSLPRQARGEPIKADLLNALADAQERASRMQVTAPLGLQTIAGVPRILPPPVVEIDARIVARGSGAFYSWVEVYPTSAGAWADGQRSGSTTINNALEQNGSTAVPTGTRAPLRLVNGQWIFQLSSCTTATTSATPPRPFRPTMSNSRLGLPRVLTASRGVVVAPAARGASVHLGGP